MRPTGSFSSLLGKTVDTVRHSPPMLKFLHENSTKQKDHGTILWLLLTAPTKMLSLFAITCTLVEYLNLLCSARRLRPDFSSSLSPILKVPTTCTNLQSNSGLRPTLNLPCGSQRRQSQDGMNGSFTSHSSYIRCWKNRMASSQAMMSLGYPGINFSWVQCSCCLAPSSCAIRLRECGLQSQRQNNWPHLAKQLKKTMNLRLTKQLKAL